MSTIKIIFSVTLFTCFMLLPQSQISNTNFGHVFSFTRPAVVPDASPVLIADGDPLPPPRKPAASPVLIADGDPLPPPRKPAASPKLLVNAQHVDA